MGYGLPTDPANASASRHPWCSVSVGRNMVNLLDRLAFGLQATGIVAVLVAAWLMGPLNNVGGLDIGVVGCGCLIAAVLLDRP
jgi:hypothetical protein